VTHQTYYVTVVAVIPVLAIASILEIRSNASAVADADWPQWRKELGLLYWVAQAMVTFFLLGSIPGILDALYNHKDPHDHTLISYGLTLMVTMVAGGPVFSAGALLVSVTEDAGKSTPDPRSRPRSLQREARRLAGRTRHRRPPVTPGR
jgi:hypothetical protein